MTDCWGWATWKRGWDLFGLDNYLKMVSPYIGYTAVSHGLNEKQFEAFKKHDELFNGISANLKIDRSESARPQMLFNDMLR